MSSSFQNAIDDLTKLYQGLGFTKKLIIGATITLVLAGFTYLILFADMVDYDYLFTNINDADAGEIIQYLEQRKISYRAEDRAILVPRTKVHSMRMELASQGLPHNDGVGFEIFDKQKLGTSEFVQRVNMNRALQGELGRTISQVDKVELARVHLVTPKKSLFKEDEVESSASVVLKMAPGQKLQPKEVKSIVHLVASAVEGLDPGNITVIDTDGKMLSRAAGEEEQVWGSSPLEYKGKLEKDLSARVEQMVTHVVGVGKVVANVTVELDFKREDKTEEIFDPDQVVIRSEKRVKEARQNSEVAEAGGAPGAQSNTPAGPANPSGSQNANSERERGLVNYEINKVVRHTTRQAGDMRRISVAVLVDGTYENVEEDGKLVAKYVPRGTEELRKIKELVKRAVGFSSVRGDSVEITNVPFETSALADEEAQLSFLDRYDFIPQLLRYGIILILAVVMVFFLFRPLVEWVIRFHEEERLREIEKQQEDVVHSMEEQLVEVRRTIETSTMEYKKKVQEVAQQAPDLVRAVIRSWVNAED